MDNLLTKSRLSQQPKFNQRILWLHNITNRYVHPNAPYNIRRGNDILTLYHKEKKKILKEVKMKEGNLVGILVWIVGVISALAVGSGMIDGTLVVPAIPTIITIVAGWVVVIGAILSLILAIFNK